MVTSCTAEGQGVQAVQQRVRGYKLYSRGSGGTSKRKEESKSADSSALLSEILLYSRRLRGREASGDMMCGTVRYGRVDGADWSEGASCTPEMSGERLYSRGARGYQSAQQIDQVGTKLLSRGARGYLAADSADC